MAARKANNAITITFEVPGKSEKDVREFIRTVLTNDLLLRGRSMDAAPEGAGSWGHLIAGFADIEVKAANALVPFIRVLANEEKGNVTPVKSVAKAAAPKAADHSDDIADMKAAIADLAKAISILAD
jgi:hypothetical protein